MLHKLLLLTVVLYGLAFSAHDICDSASNYRLFESSKKCFFLGNNLAFASLGLIGVAGLSTLVSHDMPFFFLALAPIPLLASLPFYITGGIQRSAYNSHFEKCGNFRRTDLSMSGGGTGGDMASDIPFGPPSGVSYHVCVGFEY
jgi:hypothetical protein